MDSNETFFIEYDDADCEEVVEVLEVEDTSDRYSHEADVKTHVASGNDITPHDEGIKYHEIKQEHDEINMKESIENDHVCVPELDEKDVPSARDIEVIESKLAYDTVDDFDDLTCNINKTDEDDLTFNENSVNQDLSVICEFENDINCLLIDAYYNEMSYYEGSFNEGEEFETKIFELKEKLLLNQDTQMHFDNHNMHDFAVIVSLDKITTDYAYCIDNSIVGADAMFNLLSCFSNFKSFFNTIFQIFGDNFLKGAIFIDFCDV